MTATLRSKVDTLKKKNSRGYKVKTRPYIGLEFVIEIEDENTQERHFYCTLCSKLCENDSILINISSYDHRVAYMKIFFPTIFKFLSNYEKFDKEANYKASVLTELGYEIEKRFNDRNSTCLNVDEYLSKKDSIVEEMLQNSNANEGAWPESTAIFIKKLYQHFIRMINGNLDADDEFYRGYIRSETPISKDQQNYFESFLENPPASLTLKEYEEHVKSSKEFAAMKNISDFDLRIEIILLINELKYYSNFPEECEYFEQFWEDFCQTHEEEFSKGGEIKSYDFKGAWKNFWNKQLKDIFKYKFEDVEAATKDTVYRKGFKPDSKISSKINQRLNDLIDKLKKHRENKKVDSKETTEPLYYDFSKLKLFPSYKFQGMLENFNYDDPIENFSQDELEKPMSFLRIMKLLSILQKELGIMGPLAVKTFYEAFKIEETKPGSDASNELYFCKKYQNIVEGAQEQLKGVLVLKSSSLTDKKSNSIQKTIELITKYAEFMKNCKLQLNSFHISLLLDDDLPMCPPPPKISEEDLLREREAQESYDESDDE